MLRLIEDMYWNIPCQCCENVEYDDKIRHIHWHCLKKLTGFLWNTIYDQTWEEVMNSNHLRIQAHQHYCIMNELPISKSPPSSCFLEELAVIFPNPKDLPPGHCLFDSNSYRIPSQVARDVVDMGVLKETYLIDAEETESSTLSDVFTKEQIEKLKSGTW